MIRQLVAASLCIGLSSPGFACDVSGTAFDAGGKPIRYAAVRLINRETQQEAFATADANATFRFAESWLGASGNSYRVDLLSAPTVVTGTRFPTRSIVGMSQEFACHSGERQDVHAVKG